MKTILVLIFLAGGWLEAQDAYRLPLKPLDFQQEAVDFYMPSINQIESDGELIYIRSLQFPEILAIDPAGNVAWRIGGQGGHPSEFPGGVLAMAVDGPRVWAIDTGRRFVRLFEHGDYRQSFRLDSYNVSFAYPNGNRFAAAGERVVVPAHPDTGALAAVYRADGGLVRSAGELVPFTEDLVENAPGINDSFWLRYGDQWLSLHKFFPLAVFYDKDFNILRQTRLEHPIIDQGLAAIYDFQPNARMRTAPILFSDAEVFRGELYALCAGRLLQIDPARGKVKSVSAFYGEGPDFETVEQPFVWLHLFTFLDDGTLVLAHPAMMWNHDLWTAKLPFLNAAFGG